MFPIKYIDNNLVWNKDNEVFAYYELIPDKVIVDIFNREHRSHSLLP